VDSRQSPVLRPPHLVVQLESPAAPGVVRRQSQPPEDDAIDLLQHQHLGQHELRFRGEPRGCLVADREDRGAGNRFLVVLDFLLDEHRVFVTE